VPDTTRVAFFFLAGKNRGWGGGGMKKSRFLKMHRISLPFALLMGLKQINPIKKYLGFLKN